MPSHDFLYKKSTWKKLFLKSVKCNICYDMVPKNRIILHQKSEKKYENWKKHIDKIF